MKKPTNPSTDAVEQRVVAFAEQLGRMAGTVQARTEGWLDPDALKAQVASIRDSAAELLQQLAGEAAAAKGDVPATASRKSRGAVDAPGKRHRKPLPNPVGVKASDTRIAKQKLAKESRRRSHD
jgi:hypothetical protein